jgi:hypothetical protein
MRDQCEHPSRTSEARVFDLDSGVHLVGEVITCYSCGRVTVNVPGPRNEMIGTGIWRHLDPGDGEADLDHLASMAVGVRSMKLGKRAGEAQAVRDLAAVKQLEGRRY